jgi:1-aminocyclopropane-1-carboxylate deaminase/D-cysteine desulfhydrase-like pyridoxal-dependent ACC family enzyme
MRARLVALIVPVLPLVLPVVPLLAACGGHPAHDQPSPSSSVRPSLPTSPAAPSPQVSPPSAPPSRYALFGRFPRLSARLPRAELAELPTPLVSSPSLAKELGVAALLVKRDGLSSPVYGGGKVRKLELVLAAARADGFGRVVTSGGVGSHHALATALFAPKVGLRARLLLLPQPPSPDVRTTLLGALEAGAELELIGSASQIEGRVADGDYLIAAGGSSVLGNLGFVNAGLELATQLRALPKEQRQPDAVFIAMGTMGSAVGLAIGLALADLDTQVVAVRASNRPTSSRAKLDAMLDDTLALLRSVEPSLAGWEMDRSRIVIDAQQLGRGYAQPTAAGQHARALYARHFDDELDDTYTAKAFASLVASARGRSQGRVLVFYNTHDAAPVDVGSAVASDLPADLRGYARVR